MSHPDYDPTTILVPAADMKKLNDYQRQYWTIKCKHWNKMVFFKNGVFWELYERLGFVPIIVVSSFKLYTSNRDAEIAARELDLNIADPGAMGVCNTAESEGERERERKRELTIHRC